MRTVLIHTIGVIAVLGTILCGFGWWYSRHRAVTIDLATGRDLLNVSCLSETMGTYFAYSSSTQGAYEPGVKLKTYDPSDITTAMDPANRMWRFGFETRFTDDPGGVSYVQLIWPHWFAVVVGALVSALYACWLYRRARRRRRLSALADDVPAVEV